MHDKEQIVHLNVLIALHDPKQDHILSMFQLSIAKGNRFFKNDLSLISIV